MRMTAVREKVNERVEEFSVGFVERLLNLNGYKVIAVWMVILGLVIDFDQNNRVLNYVSDYTNGLLTPLIWRYALILAGFLLYFSHREGSSWVNLFLCSPMVATGYYVVAYVVSGRPGAPSGFSTWAIGGMAFITLLFILRTGVIEHYREREQLLLQEIVRLKAAVKTSESGETDGVRQQLG